MTKWRILIAALLLMGIVTPALAAALGTGGSLDAPLSVGGLAGGCRKPTMANARACRQAEERILNATVRVYLETWAVKPGDAGYDVDSSSSYATVKDGRYLVTHNHFSLPMSIRPGAGDEAPYGVVMLFDSDGEFLFKGPLSDFRLVWEEAETLVFAYKEEGLFERLGLASAAFQDWTTTPLVEGAEVAQVNWDGQRARVEWTTVQAVTVDDGAPRMVLADGVTEGASGGGVFWRGVHVGNNWRIVQQFGSEGDLIGTVTHAALNSAGIAATSGL